ncbi:hypothetical protein ANN_22458 [Periplaneta americana]|uniref:Nuclease HARBI1 n=1 Tax=Periplaneta americana TaxID=6978 RepID=A0ABQ8S8M7_PERAM|nr:hypothetical protein ANN_22458 [Periplaneta americana]
MEHVNYIGVLRRFLLRRPPLRRNLLLDRSNPFETYGDAKFKASFRFSKETARDLLRDIGHLLEHDTRGCPLPITLQLLLTLRFLATGAFYAVNGDTVNVSASTVCRTIDRVLTAINSLRLRVINFPDDDELPLLRMISLSFPDNFPGIIGAIDCTHIRITCPNRERAVVYINRKGCYSINCQERVERTFGVWKKRFPCLAFGLRTKLQKTLKIIVATAVLHNLAVQHGELDLEGEIPNDDVPVDPPADDDMTGNRWRQLIIDNHFTR